MVIHPLSNTAELSEAYEIKEKNQTSITNRCGRPTYVRVAENCCQVQVRRWLPGDSVEYVRLTTGDKEWERGGKHV